MNTEPRKLTLFEKITVSFMIMLLQYDTSYLFGEHWVLYIIYGIVLNVVVWLFVEWYAYRYGRKEYLHLRNWKDKVDCFWLTDCYLLLGRKPLITRDSYQKCCELIDKLCKDKLVSIDNKKVLYDSLCRMWTEFGMGEGIYQVPIFIQEKWKKAQAEDKLRQLKKDF